MRLFCKKRGSKSGSVELEFNALFPIIIVVGVFIVMLVYIGVVGSSSYFEREFLTRDIGLMVEALQASPNDVQVNYPSDNSDKAKNLKITINKNLVEAHSYNIDPKLAPSQTSTFVMLPSIMVVNDFVASPRIGKDSNGKDIPYSYRLYFLKDTNGITSSMDQKAAPVEKDTSAIKNLINTAVDGWYQKPRVYLDILYAPSGKTTEDKIVGDVFLISVCNSIGAYQGIYSLNDCNAKKAQSVDERKAKAKDAEIVVIIYLNEAKASSSVIDIYAIGQDGESQLKSEKLAALTNLYLKKMDYDVSTKNLDEALKSRSSALDITSGKPGIIVEIGNLDKLKKDDIDKIGKAIYDSINAYYT